MPHTSKISVITVVLNGKAHLRSCLESVFQQGIQLEHVIVDGGSTDGTLDILRSWQGHSISWKSEPDRGISDAFNKGVLRSAGDILVILNADDRWLPGAAERALGALEENPNAAFCFGHCAHLDETGRKWINYGNGKYWNNMRYFMPDVNHPTMFIRRSAYDKVGLYDEKWKFAMDYDWLQRAEAVHERGVLIDAIQTEMAMGGISDKRWIKTYAEARDISIKYGVPRPFAYLDHWYRLLKGSIRRSMVSFGLLGLENRIRLVRQKMIIKK